MSSMVLTFDCNGNGSGLYGELIDLQQIGSLEVTRASFIEFNCENQEWEVKSIDGRLLFSNVSRAVCLAWEQNHVREIRNPQSSCFQ